MPLFGNLKYEEFLDIIKSSETKIIGRINQVEGRLEKIEKKLERLEEVEKRIVAVIGGLGGLNEMIKDSGILNKHSSRSKTKNKRGKSRDHKVLKFLRSPRSTLEVSEHLKYSKTYVSTLLNNLKKKNIIKVDHRKGNVPFYVIKGRQE